MMKKIIQRVFIIGALCSLIGGIGVGIFLYQLNLELPQNLDQLIDPDYELPTVIYDRNGNQVDEIFIQRRVLVSFESFPPHLIQALIASEDSRFFSHFGIDPLRMLKAAWVDLIAGEFVQGASTLTQQTARIFLLYRDKKIIRKLKEIILALRIELEFTKEEILTLYLNKVFLGNAEGVEASAQDYFGKYTEELSLAESAMLVGLLPAPSRYNPYRNRDLAKRQRNLVLYRMEQEGFITNQERLLASKSPIELSKIYDSTSDATAYYVEHIRRYLLKKYGKEKLYEGGLQVEASLDLDYQIYAHEALQNGILELSRRLGYRGELGKIELQPDGSVSQEKINEITEKNQLILGKIVKGVVTKMTEESSEVIVDLGVAKGRLAEEHLRRWKVLQREEDREEKILPVKELTDLLEVGDVILVHLSDFDDTSRQFRLMLHQEPKVNGALYVINPNNGHVLAMSGGYEFSQSQFNRAIQAKRQPGSVFKPIVYAAALDAGYTLSSKLSDTPKYYKPKDEEAWIPGNYVKNRFSGLVPFRYSLIKSLNLPTIGLVEDLGPQRVIDYAQKLGIKSEINQNLTIGLGTVSATLEEMSMAFSVFANGGKLHTPVYITKVTDKDGKVLEEFNSLTTQVISEETAFLMTDTLRDVVERGTGRRARAIGRPSAGKTGTTSNNVDAWYIGYLPQLLAGIYVGFDEPKKMFRETGGGAAAPIWVDFMKSATGNLPTRHFEQPSSILTVKIHKDGRRAIPCDPLRDTLYEHFTSGTEPPVDPQLMSQCYRRVDGTQETTNTDIAVEL